MKPAELHFEDEGIEYLKVCFALTLHWTGSIFDRREGFLEFYRRAWELVGPGARFYQTDSMKRPRKVKKDTGDLIPTWLEDQPGQRMMYILYVDNRATPDAAWDRGLMLHATEFRNVGAVSLWLPSEEVEQSPELTVQLVAELASQFPFASGHAGYSLSYDSRGEYEVMAQERTYVLSQRHPGLDVPSVGETCYAIHAGFKRVNWLTLLGDALAERFGGENGLRAQFGDAISMRQLETGVLIQAGPSPAIGDVNRRETLPLYHEVGRVLASARAKEHPGFLYPPDELIADDAKTNKWLAEFDD